MNFNEPFDEALFDPFASDQPCEGCGPELATAVGENLLPEPAALQEQLDQLEAASGTAGEDLLFAEVGEDEVSFEQELALAGLDSEEQMSLEDVIRLAERYPGLKVSFSS